MIRRLLLQLKKDTRTPIDIAEIMGHTNIVKYFTDYNKAILRLPEHNNTQENSNPVPITTGSYLFFSRPTKAIRLRNYS